MQSDQEKIRDALKPCPFCGGKARYFHRKQHAPFAYEHEHWVECEGDCGAATCVHEYQNEAIAAWNTRAEALCAKVDEPYSGQMREDAELADDCRATALYEDLLKANKRIAELKKQQALSLLTPSMVLVDLKDIKIPALESIIEQYELDYGQTFNLIEAKATLAALTNKEGK